MASASFWRNHPRIQLCVRAMASGGVIAYPTEAVWGLGCDPFNGHAVGRLLDIKQREASKGLILAAASIEQIRFLTDGLTDEQMQLLQASWPGPTTWLIPHRNLIPPFISGDSDKVAVRVSAHPVVQALCSLFGGPIVSTSANIQSKRPARSSLDVHRYFNGYPLTIAPGKVGTSARPSVIKDLTTGQVLRA